MKFLRGKMGMLTILILIIMKGTDGLTWNTKVMASVCCQGTNQFLIWNFTKGENERVKEFHWFFNEKTLVCLVATSTGFVVAPLYEGRVERNGTAGILLKNVSLNDTGEYTLYVKLEEEKEPNVQGINLTVVEPPPNQCKPIIKKEHPRGIISCSTSCERSPLSIEWIINGTNYIGDIGPYFVVNSSGTSEQPICCLRDFKCLDDYQTKFCTPNHFSFTEDMHTVNESVADTNHMVCTPILIILSSIQIVLINVVIAYVILNRRRCRLFFAVPKRHYSRTKQTENEIVELLSAHTVNMFSKDQESHADFNDVQVPEKPSPMLKTVKDLDTDFRHNQIQEMFFAVLKKLQEVEAKLMHIQEQVPVESNRSNTGLECNEDLHQALTVAATTVAVEPKHSNTVVQRNEDFHRVPTVASTTGVPQPVQVTSHRDSPDSTSYQLMWDRPDDGGSPLIKYIILYCEVEINPNGTEYELSKPLSQFVTVEISPSDVNYTLSSLKPGSYYQVEVQAVNAIGMSLSPVRFIFKTKEIAVKPKYSLTSTFAQCNEDLQQVPTVAATTDRPLQDSNQHVQIVNNISIDTDFLKSMLHSNTVLMAELQASRKETRKLKRQLHPEKHLRKKENRPKYSYVTPVKCRYFKKNDTDSSESEDAFSELVPLEGIVSS